MQCVCPLDCRPLAFKDPKDGGTASTHHRAHRARAKKNPFHVRGNGTPRENGRFKNIIHLARNCLDRSLLQGGAERVGAFRAVDASLLKIIIQPIQQSVAPRSGHALSLAGDHQEARGHGGKGVKDIAFAVGVRRSSHDTERNVSPQLASDLTKLLQGKRLSAKTVHGTKNCRAVGAASRHTCRHGNVFLNGYLRAKGKSYSLTEFHCRANRDVFFVRRHARHVTGRVNAACGQAHRHVIEQGYGLHHGLDPMIAPRHSPRNIQM